MKFPTLTLLVHLPTIVLCSNSITLDLSSFFNGKAASTTLGNSRSKADFDGSGRAYPAEFLPKGGSLFTTNGIDFVIPPFDSTTKKDFIQSNGQTISVPSEQKDTRFHSFHGLAAGVWTPSSFAQARPGNLTFHFADGSTEQTGIIVGPWFSDSPFNGPIHTPWHWANPSLDYNTTIDHNITHILYVTSQITNDAPLTQITLPGNNTFINWFSISLRPVAAAATTTTTANLDVQLLRSTTKWQDITSSGEKVQTIEILLDNTSPKSSSPTTSWLDGSYSVSIDSAQVETVTPARLVRLRSNDQVRLQVGVKNKPGVAIGQKGTAKAVVKSGGRVIFESKSFDIVAGIPEWTDDDESLMTHEAPDWFDDAKFGIFIHWGVYSVPAWAPTGQQYAEWYNWQFHNPPNSGSPTWVHHLQTYGTDIIYNDFIANFTASAWNPDEWVDLFHDAGAKYFVLVTKHHDGFALFDTGNSSNRNAVKMGPRRDLLKDLFASAKTRHPEMRRGTYFSLPEWFNPDYEPYARTKFPGQPALYAFNHSCCEPYAGWIPQNNFITDIQTPQLKNLFYDYETDILWCDADGKSAFPSLAADWYNFAASQGRQVTRSNRCGANFTDFVTPEYVTYPARLSQKWESSAGIDPFSYGYNSDTPPQNYQKASDLIVELIDIVSKGGNFLLDIGPTANGSVIVEETQPLLEIGRWLNVSGEAIYGTQPFWITPADQVANLRFTTKTDAFYMIALTRPSNGSLTTSEPVPIMKGDVVTMLGHESTPLEWNVDEKNGGVLTVMFDEGMLDVTDYAWAFKIAYRSAGVA